MPTVELLIAKLKRAAQAATDDDVRTALLKQAAGYQLAWDAKKAAGR